MGKLAFFVVLLGMVVIAFLGISNATKIEVDDDFNIATSGWDSDHFDKIQDAINAANDGDIIFIHNGTYNERLTINKEIKLIGENEGNVIINGNGGWKANILYNKQWHYY